MSDLDEFVARARGVSRQGEFDAAARELIDALDAAGIDSLLLKGPALVRLLYAPHERRGYSDVDLLIQEENLPLARQALGELGYLEASARTIHGVIDVAGVQHSETWNRRGREGPLLVDLHWRLDGCDAPAETIWRQLAAHRASIDLGGRDIAVPDRVGLALHVAIHAAQHGPGDLKTMGDLERGLERWPVQVWRDAARLAGEVEGTAAFAAGLRLKPEGASLADTLDLPPTDQRTWEVLHRDARPRGTFHLQALAEARGIRKRANVLGRSLFPTRRWMTRQYPWAERSRVRLSVAYVAHVVRAPVWAARAWRFRRRARRARDSSD